jgi:acyl carrier protein
MTELQVQAEMKAIFRKIAPEVDFDHLDLTKPLREQVEIDSLDFYNILVKLHQATGVMVPESVVIEIPCLRDLISYVAGRSAP